MSPPKPIEFGGTFLDDFLSESAAVQDAATAEIPYISANPSQHGSILMGGWGDTVRYIDIGNGRMVTWIDFQLEPPVLLSIEKIPTAFL